MTISQRTLGLILAFGAGVLISAVAYELVFEAVKATPMTGSAILGVFAGAVTFFVSDRYVSGMVDSKADSTGSGDASSLVVPMVLGIILDGIPESVALGLGLLEGGTISIAMLVAVFISNLPEAIAGTSGLKASGCSPVKTLSLWLLIALVCGGASAAGFALLAGVPETWIAFVQTFAAGAILTMLANEASVGGRAPYVCEFMMSNLHVNRMKKSKGSRPGSSASVCRNSSRRRPRISNVS